MASSAIPSQAQSLDSYEAELWHMSWGETECIATLKDVMTRKAQQGTWQSKPFFPVSDSSPWCKARGQRAVQHQSLFQPVCIMMTRSSEIQHHVPPGDFSRQHKKLPLEAAHADNQDTSGCTEACYSAQRHCAGDSGEQGLTEELPSIGSKGHFDGSCKRCAFFSKGRCKNGKDCNHCHFAHEPRSRLRKRTLLRVQQPAHGKDAARKDESAKANMAESYHSQMPAGLSAVTDARKECHSPDYTKDTPSSDSDGHRSNLPLSEVPASSDCAVVRIEKLNNALQVVANAYMSDFRDFSKVHADEYAELACDISEADTTPSASAVSDHEEGASCDTSDSELSSLQESTPCTTSRSLGTSLSTPIWCTMHRSHRAAPRDGSTPADIKRMARSLLNKLTTDRFESLCKQVLALPLSTPEHLSVLAAEIFAKATTQDCFRTLYTELCMRLDAHLASQTSDIGGRAFRRALVSACQATFEHHLEPADAAPLVNLTNDDECFEMHLKMKTRRLGNMRFIGDLLVRRLLAPKLLPQIVHKLLSGSEDALESLIALISVVASEFGDKASPYQAPLLDALRVLNCKLVNKSVCPRMCCQIQDLFDAKARGWASRSVCT